MGIMRRIERTRSRASLLRDAGPLATAILLFAATALPARSPELRAETSTATSDPSAAAVEVAPSFPLSPAAVQKRADALATNTDLAEALREKAAADYRDAIDALALAQRWNAEAERWTGLSEQAPQALQALVNQRNGEEHAAPRIDWMKLPLAEAEKRLSDLESELEVARRSQSEAENERTKRSDRRVELQRLLSDKGAELEELSARIDEGQAPDPSDEARLADRAAALAHREALASELRSYKEELRSYDVRREVTAARRDLLGRELTSLQAQAETGRSAVNELRRTQAQEAADRAVEDLREVADLDPVLHPLADRNAELAALRTGPDGLSARMEKAQKALSNAESLLTKITEESKSTRAKAESVGFTDAIGLLLRKQRAELPPVARFRERIRARQEEIGKVQLELLELEDAHNDLVDLKPYVKERLAAVGPDVGGEARDRIAEKALELLSTQRNLTESLIDDYDSYFSLLVDLDAAQRRLIQECLAYQEFVEENILWIRSAPVVGPSLLAPLAGALVWLVSPQQWTRLAGSLSKAVTAYPAPFALALLAWGLLLAYRRRLQELAAGFTVAASKGDESPFVASLYALALTFAVAALWPALMYLAAWLLSLPPASTDNFSQAAGAGLAKTAAVYLLFESIRKLCVSGGPARRLFSWPERPLGLIRKTLSWAELSVLPAVFLVHLFEASGNQAWSNALGRLAFFVAMAVIAVAARRALQRESPVTQLLLARSTTPLAKRAVSAAGETILASACLLIVVAAAGYYFTALELVARSMMTLWVLLLLGTAKALTERSLALARRRLARKQREEKRAQAQADTQAGDSEPPDSEAAVVVASEDLDLSIINAQTRQLLRSFFALALLMSLWIVWQQVFPAFRAFDRFELWSVGGEPGSAITLGDFLLAAIVLLMTIVATRNVPGLLELVLLQRLSLDTGLRYATTAVARYVIGAVGAICAFQALGISWEEVQWLVAAMTVGLGFGLQEIFANFISGLIILFERPIRVGDTVTIGDVSGTVARIRIRATTVIDWDRKELIVPNKEFITGQLINWTLSDRVVRVVVPVGVAYGSDTALVEQTLLRVAKSCPYAMSDPSPTVLFADFGSSSLDFKLRVFIASFDNFWQSQHYLHMNIDAAFREAGIEISFPQRDLHLRSVESPLSVTLTDPRPREA